MKIKCLDKISKVGLNALSQQYTLTDSLDDADAVLVRSTVMHDITLNDKTLCVARAGAGVNNIPLVDYAEKGIVVFNTPGANANGVKELVIAGLLISCRDIVGGINWVNANKQDENISKTAEKAKKSFAGNEVFGKKIGVIGLGAIGVLVANACVSLGMKVYGADPFLSVENAMKLDKEVIYVKSNDDIFEKCDYITIHVPALPQTKGMINKDAFNKMKKNVTLLNFSRDVLVNENDLLEAIDNGKIKKYVTDFPNANIVNFPKNVIVLPHLGASTDEAEENCAFMAVKEVMDYIENGNIKNSVNYPNVDAGVCKTASRITVNHKNYPGVFMSVSDVFAKEGFNISSVVSQSKGEYAYAVYDIDSTVSESHIEKIAALPNVCRVRLIK